MLLDTVFDNHPAQELELLRSAAITGPLYRHAFHLPDRDALVFEGSRLTYRELLDRVVRTSARMRTAGVEPGDRVGIVAGNHPAFIVAALAAIHRGAILVPVNFRLVPEEIGYILGDCSPVLVLADDERAPAVQEALSTAGLDEVAFESLVDFALGGERSEDPRTAADAPPPEVPDAAADMAIMYTSGTTGRPKGAVLSYANFQAVVARLTTTWDFAPGQDSVLIGSPLFHIAAFDATLGGLSNAATLVVLPSTAFDAGEMLDAFQEHRITQTALVPAQYQLLVEEQRRQPRTLHLKVYNWGAAPATEKLLTDLAEMFPGARSQAAFGQTETTAMGTMLAHEDSIRKLGSVGLPVPGFAIRVVDPQMNDVPVGEVGEIVYRGPGVMSRYWNRPEATAEAFTGGWFHSGDLVRQDEDGFVYVVDRLKDMIISGGENIYCAELENVLAWHPGVQEIAVVGRPDEKWGEIPVAVVVPTPGQTPTLEELREFSEGKLARYKLPKDVVIVSELPRSGTGKVQKVVLREELVTG